MHHPRGARQTRCRPPCEICWTRGPKTSVAHPRPPLADERIHGPAREIRPKSAGRSQRVQGAPFGGRRGVPGVPGGSPRPGNRRNDRLAMISGQEKEPWEEPGTLRAHRSGGDGARQKRTSEEDRKLDRSGRVRSGTGLSNVSPRFAEGVRREAWPRPPAGDGSVHASLDLRAVVKLIRPPQHFLPDPNGSATVSRLQEARTAGSPPIHIVAVA